MKFRNRWVVVLGVVSLLVALVVTSQGIAKGPPRGPAADEIACGQLCLDTLLLDLAACDGNGSCQVIALETFEGCVELCVDESATCIT